jgi:hypothetical protein
MFAGALLCGLILLPVVWLGHTYYLTTSVALLIVCSCRKCYWFCLKICHWRFDVTCGFSMMGRQRILVHRPNSTSTHSFLTRWLGCGSPVSWRARLLDLNPLDFFFWGHLKEIVYRDLPTVMEDLTAKFHAAVATIDADMLRRVQASIPRHAVACQRMHGGICCVLCRQALYASQVLFILTCLNCAFFLCTLFFCINSLVHECHLQFLCSYSTLHVSASVSRLHH